MRLWRVPASWYRGAYEDSKECVDSARSFSLLHESSDKGVLLVHGYAGYPGELESPAQRLFDAGFDVFVPRLPGMGTSGEDFRNTSEEDWLTVVKHAVRDLEMRYPRFSIAAHSMGCPLSLIAAEGRKVEKIVLAAPAFRLRQKVPVLALRAMALTGRVMDIPWQPDPSYRMHYEGAPKDDGYLGREYWSHLYPKQMLSLLKVMKEGKKALGRTAVPVLMMGGSCDPLCSFDVQELLKHGQYLELAGGTHQLFYDPSPEVEEKCLSLMEGFLG